MGTTSPAWGFILLKRVQAHEAISQVKQFLESHLRLLVNQDKSKVAKRFKMGIQQITSRSRGVSLPTIFTELRRYCTGWFHYFKIGLSYKEMLQWDQWIRRRVRLCHWKQWKRPRKRRRELIRRGIAPERVNLATRSRKGYWRMAGNSLLQIALSKDYLKSQGLPGLRDLWLVFKY